jgi:hypothetical protein
MGGASGNIVYITMPTFRWNTVLGCGVTEYQLELARDEAFNQLDSMRNIPGEYTGAYTYDVYLVDGIVYYWHMRAKNSDGYGPWSITRHFRVALTYAPPAPPLENPRDGETNVIAYPTFEWGSVPSVTEYLIQVSENSDFSGIIAVATRTSNTSYVPDRRLRAGQRYYWRVKSYREDVVGPYGEVHSFTTLNDTDKPVIRDLSPTTIKTLRVPVEEYLAVGVIDQGSPPSGIEKVMFKMGACGMEGTHTVSEQTRPWRYNWYRARIGGLNEGTNKIGIEACDKAGNRRCKTFNVEVELVEEEPPQIKKEILPPILPKGARSPIPKGKLPVR